MKEITNGETGLRNLWKDMAHELEEKIYFGETTHQSSQIIQG